MPNEKQDIPTIEEERNTHLNHLEKVKQEVLACQGHSSLVINFLPEVKGGVESETEVVSHLVLISARDKDIACVVASLIRTLAESEGESGREVWKKRLDSLAKTIEDLYEFSTLDNSTSARN